MKTKLRNGHKPYNFKFNKNTGRRFKQNKYKKDNTCIILLIIAIIIFIGWLIVLKHNLDIIANTLITYNDNELMSITNRIQGNMITDLQNKNNELEKTNSELKKQVTSRSSEERQQTIQKTKYKITSYHPGDGYSSGTVTGSGKSIKDFNITTISGKDVYTYKGNIVVAAATQELYNTGYSEYGANVKQADKHYFRYYDTLQINIDGNWYNAVVLDSCGASMWQGEYRVDIFVPTAKDVINRTNVDIKF